MSSHSDENRTGSDLENKRANASAKGPLVCGLHLDDLVNLHEKGRDLADELGSVKSSTSFLRQM